MSLEKDHIPEHFFSSYPWQTVNDTYCFYWKDAIDPVNDWDHLFNVGDPIIFRERQELGLKQQITSDTWPDKIIREYIPKQNTGYLRPEFRFLSSRIIPMRESIHDFLEVKEGLYPNVSSNEINIELGIEEEINLINKIGSYKQTLFSQINRQVEKIDRINKKMADVLKLHWYELTKYAETNSIDSSRLNRHLPELQSFFNQYIRGGAHLDHLEEYALPKVIYPTEYCPEYLSKITTDSLLTYATAKEPALKIAHTLVNKVRPIESILENHVTGSIFSEKDYARMRMPQPKQEAQELYKATKNKQYSVSEITKGMRIVREYVIEHNLNKLQGKKKAIREEIQSRVEEVGREAAENWIERYFIAAEIRTE